MAKVSKSPYDKSIPKSSKLYHNEKEDLQKSIVFFFGDHIDDLKDGSQQFKSAMLKFGALGVVGSVLFYYLLIFHT